MNALNYHYILDSIENKATSTLSISDSDIEKIILKFRSDVYGALDNLCSGVENIATLPTVRKWRAEASIGSIGEQISDFINNWSASDMLPTFTGISGTAGAATMAEIRTITNVRTFFNITDDRLSLYNRLASEKLAETLTASTFSSIKTIITDGIYNNLSARDLQQRIFDVIPLSNIDTINNDKFYKRIYEQTFQDAIDSGLTVRQAEKKAILRAGGQAKKQALRLRNLRAERIHRTETSRLKHNSDKIAMNQAIDSGAIDEAEKIWRRTGFNDNWQSSVENDGVSVGINDVFPYACETGSADYPSEINERCYLEYRIKYKKRR